eukprot:scaffold19974_cov71-Attheya_sp.AAC.4
MDGMKGGAHMSTSRRLVTALICICVGNIDHTSSKALTARSGHVRSSDKEGSGIGGDRELEPTKCSVGQELFRAEYAVFYSMSLRPRLSN